MDNAQIAVVRCLMPTPMLLETFTIDCKRVLCMKVCMCVFSTSSVVLSNDILLLLGYSCFKPACCG